MMLHTRLGRDLLLNWDDLPPLAELLGMVVSSARAFASYLSGNLLDKSNVWLKSAIDIAFDVCLFLLSTPLFHALGGTPSGW